MVCVQFIDTCILRLELFYLFLKFYSIMKARIQITVTQLRFLFVFTLLGLFITVNAQKIYNQKTFKMMIRGTSSVHDWTEDVTILVWVGEVTVVNKEIKAVKNVIVKIPVTGIKSTKGGIMDDKTYEAFNYKQHPDITYKLEAITKAGGIATATGKLTMNGVTKPVSMRLTSKIHANGDIQVMGAHQINMKDFQMKPPTAMMGSIKVGELITVSFDITVTPKKIK